MEGKIGNRKPGNDNFYCHLAEHNEVDKTKAALSTISSNNSEKKLMNITASVSNKTSIYKNSKFEEGMKRVLDSMEAQEENGESLTFTRGAED